MNNVRPFPNDDDHRQPGCIDVTVLVAVAIVLWGASIALAIGLIQAVT